MVCQRVRRNGHTQASQLVLLLADGGDDAILEHELRLVCGRESRLISGSFRNTCSRTAAWVFPWIRL
jgi:hypothetical protein